MSWQGRTVLVTGAGGFIGSHLAERLVDEGATTRAMVHYNALGSAGWLDTTPKKGSMEVLQGDIRDADFVRHAMRDVDVVFHLAALIGIPYSYVAPTSYVQTNVEGTLNVLQAGRDCGTDRILLTSTSEVYGTAQTVPISEEHPLQAQSPYAASKIAADKLGESFHLSFELPLVTVRPFNTYGPRQSTRAVIPTIIARCLAGRPVELGNLYPTRDLNFVSDTVDGFVKSAVSPTAVGRTINLGAGEEISIGDLAALIVRLTRADVPIRSTTGRQRPGASEVERLVADNARARKLLGWEPMIRLEEGLTRTIAWFRKNSERYDADGYSL